MTEQTIAPNSLAERALQRLRKIASGNNMEPAAIDLIEVQEQIFELKGRMEVSPMCEVVQSAYPGPPQKRDSKILASFGELQQAVAAHQQAFRENPDWIPATIEEMKTHEANGWGLENAKVTLPQKSASFAATSLCPACSGRKIVTCEHCNGQGQIICRQCQGVGRELCYYCGGRGEDPQQPGQRCHTCEGTKYALCRFCRGNKYLPCPTCQGRRGTPCTQCNATGKLTQEATVTCGAETHFKLQAEGLPSGLRRGLERIGIANLGKGHADIVASRVTKEEQEAAKEGAFIPILNYKAKIPYAEMRMAFGQKKAVVSAVGKRCAINGVPNFLDGALQNARNKLHEAALGQILLEPALEFRALRDALQLSVAGKGKPEEMRRLYPFGLSAEAMNNILSDMRMALNKVTLKSRTVSAVVCALLSGALFYLWFVAGYGLLLTYARPALLVALIDLAVLAATVAGSWAMVNFVTRFVLQRRFPQMAYALKQKIGKTGRTMIGFIIAFYLLMMILTPVKPIWLFAFLR